MANFNIDPNMGFPNPIPGVDAGPDYANNIQTSLTTIGAHNHSAGNGILINPNGININSDLPMNGNNLTIVKTVNYSNQVSTIPAVAPNLGCTYVAIGELTYNDEAGNIVQITKNGSVNAGAGSISGLPSGTASASYSAGTFIWQSATNTPANLDAGSVIFRNNTANSKGVTLSPVNSLGSNYQLFLPQIPGSTSLVTLDSSGNFGASVPYPLTGSSIATNSITRTNIVTTGQQVSASSGVQDYAYSGTSYTQVINLSVTITNVQNPIMLIIQPDGITDAYVKLTSTPSQNFLIAIFRGATNISERGYNFFPVSGSSDFTDMGRVALDVVSPGTYTYTVQIRVAVNNSVQVEIGNYVLVAYEL